MMINKLEISQWYIRSSDNLRSMSGNWVDHSHCVQAMVAPAYDEQQNRALGEGGRTAVTGLLTAV